jgi:hypothetical protein
MARDRRKQPTAGTRDTGDGLGTDRRISMRRILTLAVAALMTSTLAAAVNIAGTWKGTIDTQMGAMEIAITFQEGSEVAGTIETSMVSGKIENGKLDGDHISFELTSEMGKLTFDGTVAGDEMKLSMTGPSGNKYALTAKRQKKAER